MYDVAVSSVSWAFALVKDHKQLWPDTIQKNKDTNMSNMEHSRVNNMNFRFSLSMWPNPGP